MKQLTMLAQDRSHLETDKKPFQ